MAAMDLGNFTQNPIHALGFFNQNAGGVPLVANNMGCHNHHQLLLLFRLGAEPESGANHWQITEPRDLVLSLLILAGDQSAQDYCFTIHRHYGRFYGLLVNGNRGGRGAVSTAACNTQIDTGEWIRLGDSWIHPHDHAVIRGNLGGHNHFDANRAVTHIATNDTGTSDIATKHQGIILPYKYTGLLVIQGGDLGTAENVHSLLGL